MSTGDDVFKEVRKRLERALASECPPDMRQLLMCVDPAFERYNDLVSDNKRLSAMQHFVLSDLKDIQAKEKQLEQERRLRNRILKTDVEIQEPERIGGSDESSSEDEKPVARSARKKPPEVLPELEFTNGITDAAQLKFDPLSRPVPTPWRQRTKGVKAHFAKYKKDLISHQNSHGMDKNKGEQ